MRYPQVAGNLENITVSLCLGMVTLSVGAYLCFRVFPMRAHSPRNETLDSLSTLTSQYSISSRVKSRTAGRGQWVVSVN
jgi:hypothetical protein